MRNLILSILVLLSMCAIASKASAQTNPCERVLFHAPPKNCPPGSYETADQFRQRQDARAQAYRAREDARLAYEARRRAWVQGPSAYVRCGVDPVARFCTYGGIELGWSWDRWNWGGYRSYSFFGPYWAGGYYHRDPDFAGGKYWVIPYDPFGTECPATPPPNTAAPHNYEWRCEHGVDAIYAAYVKRGRKQVLRDYAQSGTRRGAIVVTAKADEPA